MKYLKVFDTKAQQTEFRLGENYIQPHVSCIIDGTSIGYNRTYIENFWVNNGYTNPLPDKLLLLNDDKWWWDIMYLDQSVEINTEDIPQEVRDVPNFSGAYELTDAAKNELGWQVFDINEINADTVENNSNGNWAFFLWKIPGPTLTVGQDDDEEALMYVYNVGSGEPRWAGGYWATNTLTLKIGNDYYMCFVYTPD